MIWDQITLEYSEGSYLFWECSLLYQLQYPCSRWKIHEACMLALGSVKSIITDSVKNGRIHFDMHGFLTNVILVDLNLSGMFEYMPGF